jgi:predicted ATPase
MEEDRMGTTSTVAHSLPRQTTSFIDRRQEIASIIALLDNPDCQLLTLWGPGGIGKTRLAIEIAKQIGATFPNGVHYVALQPLHSVDQALHAIINLLGLVARSIESAHQQLLWYLGDKRLLLLLDNFEHLPGGAGLVSDILTAAPLVKVLVTSRETLNLREEWLWEVRGLSYPQQDAAVSPETYSAIQLFIERARQVRPGFTLAEAGVTVVRICQLVEGMPLALELAASWTKTLSCNAIEREIQRKVDFLTSRASNITERHRSTRAVFNHSWRLLGDEERSAFPKLTVFHGSFTREAAEQVGGVSLSILASLVDKSLVRQDDRGRYDIHELLRQFGDEQLATTDAAGTLKDSHATYFAGLIARCEPGLKGDQQLSALNTIEVDFDNVRAAWAHAVAQCDYYLVDRMIDGLFLYCRLRSRMVEGQALFDMARVALAPAPGEAPHPVWGRVLVRAQREDLASIEEALTIARSHVREAEVAFCLLARGWQQGQQRRFAHAYGDLRDSLTMYQRLNDRYGMAEAILYLNYASMTTGDWAASQTYIAQGSHLAHEMGSPVWKQMFLFHAGWAACWDGVYEQSEGFLRQAEDIANTMGFREYLADTRGSLGFLVHVSGNNSPVESSD